MCKHNTYSMFEVKVYSRARQLDIKLPHFDWSHITFPGLPESVPLLRIASQAHAEPHHKALCHSYNALRRMLNAENPDNKVTRITLKQAHHRTSDTVPMHKTDGIPTPVVLRHRMYTTEDHLERGLS